MQKVILAVILVLSTATVSAQTIIKRDAQMAWEASGHDTENMRVLINVYTALQESGYQDFPNFFRYFIQYRDRVDRGVIDLLDDQGLVGGFLDYLQILSGSIGTSEYDEIYTLVFAWNQSVRVSALLEHITFLRPLLLDDDVRAMARENVAAAKKILNIT